MGSATTSSAGQSFFRGSLQALAFQGVSEIGLHLDLPPPFTNALAVVAGTMTGAVIDPSLSISQGLQQLAPQLASDFALSGFVALGNKIGLDWRITALISTPVMASVAGITRGLTGPNSILDSLKQSFLRDTAAGLVSVGSSIGLDALGAPAVLQNYIPGMLGQLVAGSSGSTGGGGGPGPDGIENSGKNIFQKITDGIAKFGKGLVSAGQQIVSFGQKVVEGVGSLTRAAFSKAVDFFSGIFDRQTQETLVQAGGGSIEIALNNSCNDPINGVINCNVDGVNIQYNQSDDHLSYSRGVNSGSFLDLKDLGGFFGGNIAQAAEISNDGSILKQNYQNGSLSEFDVLRNGQKIFEISSLDGHTPLAFDNVGGVYSGKIINYLQNGEVSFLNGSLEKLNNSYYVAPPDYLIGHGFSENDVVKVDVGIQKNAAGDFVANVSRGQLINNFDISSQVGKYDVFANANFQTGDQFLDPFLRLANSANNAAGYLFNSLFNVFGYANETIDNLTGTTLEERVFIAQSTPLPVDDLIALGLSSIDRTGKFLKTFQVVNEVVNPLPSRYVRVVPKSVGDAFLRGEPVNLGVTDDVFIAAADDLANVTSSEELSRRLTLLDSSGNLRTGPFTVIEFGLPSNEGVAVPVFRNNPGFIQGGRTMGGAREYVITNRTTEELEDVIIRSYE